MRVFTSHGNTVSVLGEDATAARGWSVELYCEWIEWLRRSKYKWYDFTFIEVSVEDSWRCTGYAEIRVGLLGFLLVLTRWRPCEAARLLQPEEEG